MFDYVKYYLLTVRDVEEESLALFAQKRMQEIPGNVFFIPYKANREERSFTLLYFSAAYVAKPSRRCVTALADTLFCHSGDIDIEKTSFAKINHERPEVAATVLSLLKNQHIRSDEDEVIWTTATEEEVMATVSEMSCYGDFAGAINKIKRCMDNRRGRKFNYNVAVVNESGASLAECLETLYKFYCARGVIIDQRMVIGDLSDAVATRRDTPFMYVIRDDFSEGGSFLFGRSGEYSDNFQRLIDRKTIFVIDLEKEEYEMLSGCPAFNRMFPFVLRTLEPGREEKLRLIKKEAEEYGFELSEDFAEAAMLDKPLETIKTALVSAVMEKLSGEGCGYLLSSADIALKGDDKTSVRGAMEELESLTGLASVKKTVREIAAFVRNRGKNTGACLHMVFRGNPGTGKTTVARIIGRILADIGVIKDAECFVEADRNKLVSKYLGGTAARTAEVVKSALGGVLFIDEAYSLFSQGDYDYGAEAVSTLVKLMEDHRKEFVCIMAGYTDEMDKMLDMNPGLRGRIQFYIDFPDYSAAEMLKIFKSMCEAEKYTLAAGAEDEISGLFSYILANKDGNFANGRTVRSVFERLRFKQALRGEGDDIAEEDALAVREEVRSQAERCEENKIRRIGFRDVA